jgi:hypothetical protein
VVKPKFVRFQALAVLLVTAIGVVLLGPGADLAAGIEISVGAAIWLYFFVRYEWLRGRSSLERTTERAGKDRTMVVAALLGLALPAAFAYAAAVEGGFNPLEPPLRHGLAVLTMLCALTIPLAMLVSSAVDWYLIRPFREGVYELPACQPEKQASDEAKDYARYWIAHRMVCEFFVYLAISGLIALAATIAGEETHSNTGTNILNLLGVLGILAWSLVELGKLKAALAFVRYPTCSLASWVRGRNAAFAEIEGFVLDVSVDPGVQLIDEPRGYPAGDIADPKRSVPLSARETIETLQPPRPICPGQKCEFWIPDCEFGIRALHHREQHGMDSGSDGTRTRDLRRDRPAL